MDAEPEFANKEGKFRKPDLVVVGGVPREDVPESLTCDAVFVLYSSWADWVAGCKGFAGPDDRDNAMCQSAAQSARQVAGTIACPKACPKRQITEIFRGWDCSRDPELGRDQALAAVEVEIRCRIEV